MVFQILTLCAVHVSCIAVALGKLLIELHALHGVIVEAVAVNLL